MTTRTSNVAPPLSTVSAARIASTDEISRSSQAFIRASRDARRAARMIGGSTGTGNQVSNDAARAVTAAAIGFHIEKAAAENAARVTTRRLRDWLRNSLSKT